jgi:hypothetical protein
MSALDANLETETADGLRPFDWRSLAAAPIFAIMALLTGVLGSGHLNMICSATIEASPLSGMIPMYLLMSAFHSAPWLRLISKRRNAAYRCWSGAR